jgi:hypothetical protein
MKRFLRDNGLTLFFGLLFFLALGGQAVSGYFEFNNQQVANGGSTVSPLDYLTSSDFGVDTAENWQSEFLQFFLYITATIFLIQRGSPESKPPGRAGTESERDQQIGVHAEPDSPALAKAGGPVGRLYSHSLGLTMLVIFVLSWLAQGVAGRSAYNARQLAQLEDPVGLLSYIGSADFWNRTLQNWQSEFLAIAAMVVLSIFLRQRGSPESKPVGAAHTTTGAEG